MPPSLLEALRLPPPKKGLAPPPRPSASADAGEAAKGAPAADADERARKQARRLIDALDKSFGESITRAQAAVNAQPVDALKAALATELDAFATARAEVDKLDPAEGAKRIRKLDGDAHAFATRAEDMRKSAAGGLAYQRDRGDAPFAELKATLDAQPADVQAVYRPRFEQVKGWHEACRPLLDKGEFDKHVDAVGRVYLQIQTLNRAIVAHGNEKPAYDELRTDVLAILERLEKTGLLDADGVAGVRDLRTAVSAADALGPLRGYAAAKASLNDVVAKALVLRGNNDAYRDYVGERDKVAAALAAVRAHAQAGKLAVELGRVDDAMKAAEKLSKRVDGGALKALTALRTITADIDNLKKLAGKLAAAEKKLPALTKKLESGGVAKDKVAETARMAVKLLVEEECSEDEAVKMAKDASGYRGKGLDEHDAMMSSRVKASLEKQGVAADQAEAIGRNLRAGGSSTADDAKALAAAMKGMSKKAIDTLTDAGIHTECCRGAITDAFPDLAGEHPRGWPDLASWDQVPGVYKGDKNTIVVGTAPGSGGTRKVPAKGEGHGAIDLFGHEAGHAFDVAGGGKKREHADFVAARQADIDAGRLKGKRDRGPDSYFLTPTEGGTNDKGAASETFAESFAFHTSGKATRWTSLKDFWLHNPWGI